MPDSQSNVISVSAEAKIGLPKYSNVTATATASVVVEENIDAEQRKAVYADLWREVNEQLQIQIHQMVEQYTPLVA